MNNKWLIFIFLISSLTTSQAQDVYYNLYGASTAWGDSFKEWTIYADEEEIEGDLTLRWGMREAWTAWDYRLEDESGTIKIKWMNDASQWELRGGGEIITMKTIWLRDFTEWRISDGSITIKLRSKYKDYLEEWETVGDKYGSFEMITTYENDLRDWDIVDDLTEEVSLPMKMAMMFIVLFNSTPKV